MKLAAGATVVRIGSADTGGVEGGGLIIDYTPLGSSQVMRSVLAFNDMNALENHKRKQ